MSIESCLQEEAEQAALSIQSRIGELEREIWNKTQERAKLVDELNHARLASNRLEKYQIVYGSNILCPYCWWGGVNSPRSPGLNTAMAVKRCVATRA